MRALPDCPHRPACPGCPRFGERGLDPAPLAAVSELARKAGLPTVPVIEGPPMAFRHRARLAVRGRVENPKIGIFAAGSHRALHIPDCRVHHPLVNRVARVVRDAMIRHRVPPYSDIAHQGTLRYLQIVVERASESAQLVLVTRSETPRGLEPLFDTLLRELGPSLHSLWWNGHPERNNAILGRTWHHVFGPDSVREVIGETEIFYPPGAFGQSNLPLADRLAARVRDLVPPASRVAEFYAGVGALGLPLARTSQRVDLNEIAEDSLRGLELGVRALEPDLRDRIHVHGGAAGAARELVTDADVVIVDPPRKGLDRELLEAIIARTPQRLIYVSCGLPALLVEAERLLEQRRLVLSVLEAYALFPYTEHVETLAVFDAAAERAH